MSSKQSPLKHANDLQSDFVKPPEQKMPDIDLAQHDNVDSHDNHKTTIICPRIKSNCCDNSDCKFTVRIPDCKVT